jgi:hypothetical protein
MCVTVTDITNNPTVTPIDLCKHQQSEWFPVTFCANQTLITHSPVCLLILLIHHTSLISWPLIHRPETIINYVVCSKSIRIETVVVVHWVGCVCIQPWHVRTCLSNSWHKLQVAAFAQLAVVGRGSNVRLCHIDFYDVWRYWTTHLHQVLF